MIFLGMARWKTKVIPATPMDDEGTMILGKISQKPVIQFYVFYRAGVIERLENGRWTWQDFRVGDEEQTVVKVEDPFR